MEHKAYKQKQYENKTFLSFLFSTEFEAVIPRYERFRSICEVETVFWYRCPCLKEALFLDSFSASLYLPSSQFEKPSCNLTPSRQRPLVMAHSDPKLCLV